MKFQYNDGGRAASGRKGSTGDCVVRSVAIASGRPYDEIYNRLAIGNATQITSAKDKRILARRPNGKKSRMHKTVTASHGINVNRKWFKDYMAMLGFKWVPTMEIGGGCKVHLRARELPAGRLIVRVSKHQVAVIDGVIHDTYDPSRDGTRCVYGYWIKGGNS
jgi:hypothetical protein